jgi:Cu+-exporting ATPase
MKKIKLTIEGMHCAGCVGNVERALRKVVGVKEASVSLMTKKGFVEADDSISPEDLKKVIEKIGYKVTRVE